MIQPIKDTRRKNAAKKAIKNLPKPCWVQAFMIMLLHERAILKQQITGKAHVPKITLTLATLKRFEALTSGNETALVFDDVAETVTLTAPEATLPEKPKVIHNKGIVESN